MQVALFTEEGEVTGEGYARVTSRMRVDENGASLLEGLAFPEAQGNWGTVLTVGILDERGTPLFYVDVNAPFEVRAGDSMNFPSVNVTIE